MLRNGPAYFLIYSGNHFGNGRYAVGYAECVTPRGPCTKYDGNPMLTGSSSQLVGPGHQTVVQHGGRSYMLFHAWNTEPDDGRPVEGVHIRCMYLTRFAWIEDAVMKIRPLVAGGT